MDALAPSPRARRRDPAPDRRMVLRPSRAAPRLQARGPRARRGGPGGRGFYRQHARQRGAREPGPAALPPAAGSAPPRRAAADAVGPYLVVRRRGRPPPRSCQPRAAGGQAHYAAKRPDGRVPLGAHKRAQGRPAAQDRSPPSGLGRAGAPPAGVHTDADRHRPRGQARVCCAPSPSHARAPTLPCPAV